MFPVRAQFIPVWYITVTPHPMPDELAMFFAWLWRKSGDGSIN